MFMEEVIKAIQYLHIEQFELIITGKFNQYNNKNMQFFVNYISFQLMHKYLLKIVFVVTTEKLKYGEGF